LIWSSLMRSLISDCRMRMREVEVLIPALASAVQVAPAHVADIAMQQ
jgi:hypothetical protein